MSLYDYQGRCGTLLSATDSLIISYQVHKKKMARTDVTMASFELSVSLLAVLTLAAHEAGISRSELLRVAAKRAALDVLGEEVAAVAPSVLADQGAR